MDRNKFSAIAHRDHTFYNPISVAKMNKMIELVSLTPAQKVVDIGAGTGELLIRLVETHGVAATAIELYEGAIATGKQRAADRIQAERIEWVQGDANEQVQRLSQGSYDLGICIGSTHALGGLEPTLKALQQVVKKGGYILIGEGYWKQKPSADYLEALGAEETEMQSHEGNVRIAEEQGLIPLWSYVTSDDEWDDYEWLYSMSVENYCYENPDDPDCAAMLQRIRSWRQTYLKWGRDTLGFALYLFRT